MCEDPTSLKLHYNYDTYDNTMEEWWFHKSEKHERNKGAKSAAYLKKFDTYYQGPDEKVIYLLRMRVEMRLPIVRKLRKF